jgi:hypothetical protein
MAFVKLIDKNSNSFMKTVNHESYENDAKLFYRIRNLEPE